MGVLKNTRAAQHTMMSWRVTCVSVLLCCEVLSRPSLLGAAPGSTDHHAHGDHHSHGDHNAHGNHLGHGEHQSKGHDQEVSQSLDYNYAYDLSEQARSQDTDDYYDDNPDRSYAFQFAGDAYSRDETVQPDGSVEGSYSYTGGDGELRTVNYRAGAGIGFEVIDPEVEQMFASFGQKMKTSLPSSSPHAAPSTRNTAIAQPDSLYGAPPLPSYGEEPLPGYEAEPLPSASVNSVQPAGMMMDPSYYFEYKSADSERSEDADSSGTVFGSYKYRTAGGNDIEVRYRAGADTGFVVENADELAAALESAAAEAPLLRTPSEIDNVVIEVPTPLSGAPPAPQPDVLYAAPAEQVETSYEEPDTLYGAPAPLPSYEPDILPSPSVISSQAAPAEMMMMDPSYSFAYSGEESEREEDADSNGVVTGQYSYTNAEGNVISVRYKAGADIGFVVENEEELSAAVRKATDDGAVVAAARRAETIQQSGSEMSSSYDQPQADPLPIAATDAFYGAPTAPEPDFALPIAAPDGLYGAPAAPEADFALPLPSYNEPSQPDTLYGAPSESLPTRDTAPAMVMDASFNFQVVESDHSFQETADQAGERTGSYSYINPAGGSIEVRYRAGRDGFVILNPEEVLPIAPTA